MSEAGNPAAPRLTEAQKLAWLRLLRSENVGPITFRALVNRFGGAVNALAALPHLSKRGGLRRPIVIYSQADAERELEVAARQGLMLVAMGEPEYPKALIACEDAPPLLYVGGRATLLAEPAVAIVGSRNCSALGRRMAGAMAATLGSAGFVVVSGLARGVDAAAHQAALDAGTVAVMAGGADVAYPPENQPLHERIMQEGAVISEMPPSLVPRGRDFPRRNRIISGIALGTVVVEAAQRSGSLITARRAAEQGRDVFAVPGSPLDPRAEGTNMLLRDGAILTRSAADVIEVLLPLLERPAPGIEFPLAEDGEEDAPTGAPGEDARAQVLAALSHSPVEIDDIIRHTGLAAGAVLVVLLELELAGRLERHAGNRVAMLTPEG